MATSVDTREVYSKSSLPSPRAIIARYLEEEEPVFRLLNNLRAKGWQNRDGDDFYRARRERSDNASASDRHYLHQMSRQIARQMHRSNQVFSLHHCIRTTIQAFFICMAPGGYTDEFLSLQPDASVCGVTLPVEDGGHPMLIPHGVADPRVDVEFLDVTMLAKEYCDVTQMPTNYLGGAQFLDVRLFEGRQFDLVVCDGQVLRTHKRDATRQTHEATRLTNAQLILGMQRIQTGGTFIILLHKVEAWDTVRLLKEFSDFSEPRLFKPRPMHAQRSSFYLIAKVVQPKHPSAINAIKRWRSEWWHATFLAADAPQRSCEEMEQEIEDVNKTLVEFGKQLRRLGEPIWNIQHHALSRAPYTQ